MMAYCRQEVRVSATFAMKFGTNTYGASLISLPLPSAGKEKGVISAERLSPTVSFSRVRCWFSLARDTLNVFSHQKEMYVTIAVSCAFC